MKRYIYLCFLLCCVGCGESSEKKREEVHTKPDTTAITQPQQTEKVRDWTCLDLPNAETQEITLSGWVDSHQANTQLHSLLAEFEKDSLEVQEHYGFRFDRQFIACETNEMIDLKHTMVNYVYVKQNVSPTWHPDFHLYELSFTHEEEARRAKELLRSIAELEWNGKDPKFVVQRKDKVFYARTRAFAFIEFVEKYLKKIGPLR